MKHFVPCVALLLTTSSISAQNVYTATFTADTALADKQFTSWPGQSMCPAELTVAVPAGEWVDSTRIQYTYFSSLAGFGGTSLQRSAVKCLTNGTDEGQLFLCQQCNITTDNYNRIATIANGPTSGPITFQLHLGTTRLIGPNCSTYDIVPAGTWTMTVYAHSSALGAEEGPLTGLHISANDGALRIDGLPEGPVRIRLMDSTGRLLSSAQVIASPGIFTLPIADRAAGVLLVEVSSSGAHTTRKVGLFP